MKKMFFGLVTVLFMIFMVAACGDDPTLPSNNDNTDTNAEQPEEEVVVDEDTGNEEEVVVDEDTAPVDNGCALSNQGISCDTDDSCGACMICVSGTCIKGCETASDCSTGTQCNTKLARCVNPVASGQACSETNCPSGCCYAERGLSGLKCLPSPTPATCGMCKQGEIYSPEDNACITAACSATTDNCPSLNAGSTSPDPKCFACDKSSFICKADTTSSGCSAGSVINAAQCVPAGQQCVEGVSECCSGMPCVQGYCY